MNSDLDTKLCEKYPLIFRDRNASMQTTAMCWGFECGDGWYNIIDALCANIQGHINHVNKQRQTSKEYNTMRRKLLAGDESLWLEYSKIWSEQHRENIKQNIISDGARKVPKPVPQVVAVQVKEKFGTLRFYYDGGDNYISGLVSLAESMSGRTCEECGSPGVARSGGWIQTLCDTHSDGCDPLKFFDE